MALALDTGRVLWSQQTLPGDAWNVSCLAAESEALNCPESEGPDYDFGSSAVLTTRTDGRPILLAGQKSGVLYGLDPDDGKLIWERRVGDGGVLGGIEWGFASAGGAAYVSVSEAFEKEPGDAGGISRHRCRRRRAFYGKRPQHRIRVATETPAAAVNQPP